MVDFMLTPEGDMVGWGMVIGCLLAIAGSLVAYWRHGSDPHKTGERTLVTAALGFGAIGIVSICIAVLGALVFIGALVISLLA